MTHLSSERSAKFEHLEVVGDAFQKFRVRKPRPPCRLFNSITVIPRVAAQDDDTVQNLVHGNGCHDASVPVVKALIKRQPQSEHAGTRQPFRKRNFAFFRLSVIFPAGAVQFAQIHSRDVCRFDQSLFNGAGEIVLAGYSREEVLDGDRLDQFLLDCKQEFLA